MIICICVKRNNRENVSVLTVTEMPKNATQSTYSIAQHSIAKHSTNLLLRCLLRRRRRWRRGGLELVRDLEMAKPSNVCIKISSSVR
jgi:hypothetical protein